MSDTGGFTPIEPRGADTGGFTPIEPTKPKTPQAQKPAPQQPEQLSLVDRLWRGIQGKDVSLPGRVAMGAADPGLGAAQTFGHVTGGHVPEELDPMQRMLLGPAAPPVATPQERVRAIDKTAQQREAEYQQKRKAAGDTGIDWARMGGNIASPINLAVGGGIGAAARGAGLGGQMIAGGLAGAAGGATEPVSGAKEDYWSQKTKQIGLGAGIGAAGGAIGSAVGGAIAPRLSGDAALLAEKGVQLAPGQMIPGRAGEIARGVEAKLQSFPILGDFVSGARKRSLISYNTATIDQALEPIGAKLPAGMQAGRNAIKAGDDAVSNAFDSVLGKIPKVNADRDLINAVKAVQLDARQRPAVWNNLKGELSQITNYLKKGDSSGRELQNMASELGRRARGLSRSENFFEREVGKHLEDVRSALYDAVERQFPKEAVELQNARSASAMMIRIGNASGRRAGSEGIFTPMDLLQAVKSGAGGVRRREFQHGDALMQDWAQAGQRLLPSMIPDSGTAGRLLLAELVGMGIDPMKTILATGGALGAGLGYRGLGAAARSQPGAVQQATAEATRRAAPTIAPGLGSYPWLPAPR